MINFIIPCAGLGTRAGLDYPKSLFLVDGDKSILDTILTKIREFCLASRVKTRVCVVIRRGQDSMFGNVISNYLDLNPFFSYQESPKGTADAVVCGFRSFPDRFSDDSVTCVIWGDCIGFSSNTLVESYKTLLSNVIDGVIPGFYSSAPYTAAVINKESRVQEIFETKDVECPSPAYTDIGVFFFRNVFFHHLSVESLVSSEAMVESSFIRAINDSVNQGLSFLLTFVNAEEKKGFNSMDDL